MKIFAEQKTFMKAVLFFTMLFISAEMYSQDTTKNRPIAVDTTLSSKPTVRPQPTSPARESEEYIDKDKVPVELDQLPMAVQQALRNPIYLGLDQSAIFQDRITGDYIVEAKSGASAKTYRFDKNGKLLEDPNKPKKKD
jgi:hypothetical protein